LPDGCVVPSTRSETAHRGQEDVDQKRAVRPASGAFSARHW
jgi:hypothetical protein